MIVISKWVVVGFAGAIGAYTSVFAVISITAGRAPLPNVVGLLLFAATLALTLLDVGHQGRLGTWRAVIATAAAAALPVLGSIGLDPHRDSYASGAWYVGGVTSIVVVLLWRRRAALAWTVLAALALQTVAWGGLVALNAIGVIAVVLLVALLAGGGWAMGRTEEELVRFSNAQREAIEWRAAQDAYRFERQIRLGSTAMLAGSMLRRIEETGGHLEPEERVECALLGQTIRDEIRGRRLLNDALREQVLSHRRRGAMVQVNDDGGIDDVDPATMEPLLDRVAQALVGLTSDRIIIRTAPRDSEKAMTVVAMTTDPVAAALGVDDGDDDQVDLWLELDRPVVAVGS